ncbi:MAG TPA: sugar phosphate isomerase/epimerase family protein [Lichenihabitans sp.]|nr:sugar phosphate isomerase/epimerase family protein [Lichenihabitans sp.]
MRFGASTFIWVSPFGNDALELIGRVKDFGFDLIEICVEDPATIDTSRIRDALDRAGLDATICGAFGPNRDMSAEDPTIRAAAVHYTRQCIDIAAALGSGSVVGPMYAGVGNTRMLDRDARRQRERAVDSLRPAADHAAAHGIRLGLEPLNRFETDLVNTVDQGLELVAEIGRDNVGLLVDTFHMNIEEKDIPAAIRRAGPHIVEFHACSSDRGTPGEDHLPWPEIVSALDEVGYAGPVVIEAFTPKIKEIARAVSLWRPLAESEDALARDGLAHLRRVFD